MTVHRYRNGEFEAVDAVGRPHEDATVRVRRGEDWEVVWPDTDGSIEVQTRSTRSVSSSSATLVGEVTEMQAAKAECWFAYRPIGEEPIHETGRRQVTGPASFEIGVDDLRSGTRYDVWALAGAGSTYAGDVLTVATP